MEFLHPYFLFALSALTVPILIHLFNFRRYKKVYFTNVRFLSDIQQETKRQSQLKQLLVLLFRLLAVAALVLAFAQPFIPSPVQKKKVTGQHAVSIYIDNSWSMEALTTDGRLIDIAKSKANEIAASFQPSDLFQLVTNDFEGRHQRFVTREEFGKLVEEVQFSPVSRSISSVIRRQNDILSGNRSRVKEAFLLSDFQKTFTDIDLIHPDTACLWYFVPLATQQRNNLYIDSVSFESPVHQPDQLVRLKVWIRNSGTESLKKVPIKLLINQVQKSVSSFSVEANSSANVVMPYTENHSGIQFGTLELQDYPVQYDDRFFFAYTLFPTIAVLCIRGNGENVYLNALYQSDSSFTFTSTSEKKINYSSLAGYSLIILNELEEISSGLNQELTRYVRAGGSLMIFPSKKKITESFCLFLSAINLPCFSGIDTMNQRISSIALGSSVYQDVFEKNESGKVVFPENMDLPVIFKHYRMDASLPETHEPLLKLLTGQVFLAGGTLARGKVYLFAVPLDITWSSFPKHEIFLPTLYKIALLSVPSQDLYYFLGPNVINLPDDTVPGSYLYMVQNNNKDFGIIPESRTTGSRIQINLHDQIRESGLYTILRDKKPLMGIGLNYNSRESDLKCLSESDLKDLIGKTSVGNLHMLKDSGKIPLKKQIQQINEGTPLWKLFIILTLIFLCAEVITIRLFKH